MSPADLAEGCARAVRAQLAQVAPLMGDGRRWHLYRVPMTYSTAVLAEDAAHAGPLMLAVCDVHRLTADDAIAALLDDIGRRVYLAPAELDAWHARMAGMGARGHRAARL